MAGSLQTKVGLVLVKQMGRGKWRASWMDPVRKNYVRRVLPASSFREAERQAREINAAIAQGMGFGGKLRGASGHTVTEAIIEAVKHSDANEQTRKDYLRRANPFIAYLLGNAKGVRTWDEVTEEIIGNYLAFCRREGRAYDTVRQRIFVLRMTSLYMSRTYPDLYRHVTAGVKSKRTDPPRAKLEEADSILRPAQMNELLGWLKTNHPMVHVWATLQGFAGLRLTEAAYLREQDIDFDKRTITITESPAHKPKNRHSYREIPVCEAVLAALVDWTGQMKVRHPHGYLFAPAGAEAQCPLAKSREVRAGAYGIDYLSQRWMRVLREARRDGVCLPVRFTARRLRASFVTALREAGADFAVLQRYIGHAPNSILSAHYDCVGICRLRGIAELAEAAFAGIDPAIARV